MKAIIDGMTIFLEKGDQGKYSFEVIKELNKKIEVEVIKDSTIESENFFNSIKVRELFIERRKFEILEIEEYLRKENFEIYICFNNGFGVPRETKNRRNWVFIFSLYPLMNKEMENIKFKNRYFSSIDNAKNTAEKVIVASEFYKGKLIENGFSGEKIDVIYPFIESDYSPIDTNLSKIYLKSKFKIKEEFFLVLGKINEASNLKKIIDFYEEYIKINKSIKIIFLAQSIRETNKFNFINSVKMNTDLITEFTVEDEVNFINSAIGVIDFTSEFVFTLTKIKALFMKKPIITDINELNLEYFEDYPIYYNKGEYLNELSIREKVKYYDDELLFYLKEKFSKKQNIEKIIR